MPKGIYERDRTGSKNPKWRGGRLKKTNGYIIVQSPDHPFRCVDGYVLEHRLVMEKKLGRYLTVNEVVHHINGIKDDNRIDNLIIFNNQSAHVYHEGGVGKNKRRK